MQWLLYGNHPSPVAFTGMTIVLVAGLYGVVSGSPYERAKADFLQIYGPADGLIQYHVVHSDPEQDLLLPDEEERGPTAGVHERQA